MKFELCAASLEAIHVAKKLNFDRIELCQNLEQGGTTPYYGMIEYAIAFGIETHVLIRPRAGGFCYTSEEIEVMLREIINCKQMGAHGAVIGALDETGLIDQDVMKEFIEKARPMEVTFHRAFDDCYHWEKSLSVLMNLGVNRVLSSGLSRNVETGLPILRKMKELAENQIEIMAGGGVSAANIKKVMEQIHPDAIHFSATSKILSDRDSLFSESMLRIDEAKAKRILDAALGNGC
jgi:copper homeostasis protein